MHKGPLGLILLLLSAHAVGGSDIWQTLFKEKLREAALGDSDAQYEVGAMYQNGRGTEARRDSAIEWYQKAAKQNNQGAISRLELMEANEARFNREKTLAESGNADSQCNLGNMYTKGVGTSMDQKQARLWYEKSASQGHVKAGYKLGLIYYEGTGVKKNSKTAFKWFASAAEKDYTPAQYYLGKMYAAGQGVKQNYTTSLEWYARAVDGGFNQARGEMIDVAENLKSQQNKKTLQHKQPVQNKKTAKKTSHAKQQQEPAHVAETIIATPVMEDLMLATWVRNEKPVSYLPSAINNCRTEESKIMCYSDDLTRETATNTIRYKTKSIISGFSPDGSFKVMYRNLVINATNAEQDNTVDQGTGYDAGDNGKGYAVKNGWGKEHTLACKLKDSGTVSCLKNKTHAIEIVSQQKLADGG